MHGGLRHVEALECVADIVLVKLSPKAVLRVIAVLRAAAKNLCCVCK